MRLVALTVLVIGSLFANQVHAEDVSAQPLTRVDCDKAEMAWDENANVCGADWGHVWGQPLTRHECDKAGMGWDDNANVCGTAAQAAEVMPQVQVAEPTPASNVADSVIQPLTRQDCDQADLTWNDGANVCGAAAASQAAEAVPTLDVADTAGQPLTREDCDKANLSWNDTANVCGSASLAAEAAADAQGGPTVSTSEVADTAGQPLTREDCDNAGMSWDDTGNVCGTASHAAEEMPEAQEPVTETASEATNPVETTVLINIDKASQKMTVLLDGVQQYEWPVSTGLRGYTTPAGTYTARSMNKIWYSRQWDNAPMPHAVFFTKDGHAIHGTYEIKRLGKPASHGCVRLSPENAALLYALVEKTGLKNTQVVLAGSTPGGEGKVESSYRSRSHYADSFPQRPRRGGIFRRLFGG